MTNVGSWQVFLTASAVQLAAYAEDRYITHLHKHSVTAEQFGSRKVL